MPRGFSRPIPTHTYQNYLESNSRNKQAEAVEKLMGRSHRVEGQKSIKNVYTL
jgi:hypothetical protein